jgi:hypoxanthine phosphoribosyltransferase
MSDSNATSELLLSRDAIDRRVRELAAEISADYRGRSPHLIGVLKGAWVFMADLIRHLKLDEVTVDFLGIASYGPAAQSGGQVRITKDLDVSIEGREVLIVEDVLDSGRTVQYLMDLLDARKPQSLKLVTLLDKTSARVVPVKADYSGFEIPDVFVVGYGLDFDQRHRHFPDIRALRSRS